MTQMVPSDNDNDDRPSDGRFRSLSPSCRDQTSCCDDLTGCEAFQASCAQLVDVTYHLESWILVVVARVMNTSNHEDDLHTLTAKRC